MYTKPEGVEVGVGIGNTMFSVLCHVECCPEEIAGNIDQEEEDGEWEGSAVNQGGEDVMEDVETEAK